MTAQPIVAKAFPKDSYTSDEIYGIARDNYLLVEDTNISPDLQILEIVACFHERNELDECREDWKADKDHETILEFRSEDGETYTKYA